MFSDVSSALGRPARKVKKLMGISRPSSSCADITREDMCTWSVAEVGEWLHHTGISAPTVGFFSGRGIDGSGLLHLTLNELVCMELPREDVGRMCKAVLEEYSGECAQQHEAHKATLKEDLETAREQCLSAQEDLRRTHEQLLTSQGVLQELRQQLEASRVACQKALRKQAAAQGWVKDLTLEKRSLKEHLVKAETCVREMEASRAATKIALEKEVADLEMQLSSATEELASLKMRLAQSEASEREAEASRAATKTAFVKAVADLESQSKTAADEIASLKKRLAESEASVKKVKAVNRAARRDGTYARSWYSFRFGPESYPGLKKCCQEKLYDAFLRDTAKAAGVPPEQVEIDISYPYDDDDALKLYYSILHDPDQKDVKERCLNYVYASVKELCASSE